MRFEVLPKTIQDAIRVTAQIGFQFLWVDSLCICQDDNEDVIREIASMPFIYTNSTVTIAAASAHAVTEGFLHNRNYWAAYIPFHDLDNHSEGTLGLMEFEENQEHLDTRGWVLQETLLSTRIVEFGSRQVSFHCRGSGHDTKWADGWSPKPFRLQRRRQLWKLREDIPRSGDEAHKLWLSLIEDYTLRNLSEPTDRNLAIASAAQLLSTVSALKGYVAGHWQSRLPLELLWLVRCSGSTGSSTKYLSPSWSWAGKNGHINFCFVQELLSSVNPVRKIAEVISVVVRLANDKAPFGAVIEGILTLRGGFRTASHFEHLDTGRWSCKELDNPKFFIEVVPDTADFIQDVGTTPFGLFEVVRIASNRVYDAQVRGLVVKEIASISDVKRYVRVGIFTFKRVSFGWESPVDTYDCRAEEVWDTDMILYLKEFEERTIELV
jgi:Heterokaryon incompatibility protein (HET)